MYNVKNGNLQQIENCLRDGGQEALEARDARGNRALHLALKFANRDATAIVKTLLDAGARVRSRDREGWKAIHHAVVTENEEIMRLLIRRGRSSDTSLFKEQAPALLKKKIDGICPRLTSIPDFYCEMLVDVSTWIPGVSRWLPSDTIKIWKAAQDIRFDVTLKGFKSGKWDRGDLSFLLLGSERKFFCLDNQAQTCTNLLELDADLTETDLDQMVHFLMTTHIYTTNFDASKVEFEKKCAWFSSAPMLENIGPWKDTRVVRMTGFEASLFYRMPQNPAHPPRAVANDQNDKQISDADSLLAKVTDHNTEIVIDPKSRHVVSVELTTGEEVTWKFTTEKWDINFGVRFLDETNSENWNEIVPLYRAQSHVNEQTGSFKACNAGRLVFTWDNSYSIYYYAFFYVDIVVTFGSGFRSKRLRFAIATINGKDDAGSEAKARVKEDEMLFRDWFGVSIECLPASLRALQPLHCIMVHTQPSYRKIIKSFHATVYMSDEFPISVSDFLPVIEVLSKTSDAFENMKEFFSVAFSDGFPVQFCLPLCQQPSALIAWSYNLQTWIYL
ncbi:hypothetical protein PsorP6_005776 [Peronosclerospora sorghi]|uniref:Uncharacterized protein n=1 Tax=Peronosclerospora sorghi TaxID=230839 RepID=A0ACC0W4J4_9STRA|nr:hypothetical protein PsorP6_005776 [Peronosclerospora sorghi]